jgi:SAM-dependent methyltransferase
LLYTVFFAEARPRRRPARRFDPVNDLPKNAGAVQYSRMTGEIYDLIYDKKDYAGQSAKLGQIIEQRLQSGGNSLLEAACGTGNYLRFLKDRFVASGFDLAEGQVARARERLPGVDVFVADMRDFSTGQLYDAVVCLFSSIGYMQTPADLTRAIGCMARHTKPGGLVIVEPWLKVGDYQENHVSLDTSTNGQMTVARMSHSSKVGNVSVLEMHHLVATPLGIDHFVETHRLVMYSDDDFAAAFAEAGLELEIYATGFTSRGLYIGRKPLR